jgi:RNA polymerase sigma-54 factor
MVDFGQMYRQINAGFIILYQANDVKIETENLLCTMLKLGLSQSLQQKLSPQQIQFIKLLQIPTAELLKRVEQELEINPALEEGNFETSDEERENGEENEFEDSSFEDDEHLEESTQDETIDLDEYLKNEDAGYKMEGDGAGADDDDYDMLLASGDSFSEKLLMQLGFLPLTEKQQIIGRQLIGSIESDGYIRRDVSSIANDLAFTQNVNTNEKEVLDVLDMIQQFDPPGIAARTLQECLMLQVDRRKDNYKVASVAMEILEDYFEDFIKKHYDKIQKRFGAEEYETVNEAIKMITRLNPKPGEAAGLTDSAQVVSPDFIVHNEAGKIVVTLNAKNAPELRVSRSYSEMLKTYDKAVKKDKKLKETVMFVKQKLDSARWFIDAIKQRQNTLLLTMNAIVQLQYEFFLSGDDSKLKPMILKDVASIIDMDISTISRVTNSKYVQTEFGIFSLKYFFSEGIASDSGEDISSREIKAILKDLIDAEEKRKPLADEKLEELLKEKGYNIARRTVAKYREQLQIPVARLRKQV